MVDHDAGEDHRLSTLRGYSILDTAPEETFDRVARIISMAMRVPMAAVTLVDEQRQWFKSRVGLEVSETPRSASFCSHTMMGEDAMVVSDATLDLRFSDNPLVLGDPQIRFYAGYPIISAEGTRIGAVCAIDTAPRNANPQELSLLKDLAALVVEQLELRVLAALDGLTGALRRRAFLDMASRELLLSNHSEKPSSCLMIDADHFKAINDRHGHEVGDQVLKALVRTIRSGLQKNDLVGRLGGEEFGVFLPETTLERAAQVAEEVRELVAKIGFQTAGYPAPVTISIGAAEASSSAEDILSLFHRADTALMSAKRAGRNRVAIDPTSFRLSARQW